MEAFEYTALPARVIFGFGTLPRVAGELAALDCKRAFVLSDPHHAASGAARLMDALGKLAVRLSTDAVMHTPSDVTERIMAKLVASNADCLVSLGGGSTIGLGKALALRTDLPQIVLPTTYAGSEATPVLGETHEGQKSTIRSMKVLPEVIIYDVELTYGLPPGLSLVSGINAIAHAVDALFGAWACGSCLGAVGMSLHHKLCHVLGGSFGLPHAETHTVILPHAAAYNASAAPAALDRVARALGASKAAGALFDLAATNGAPTSLRRIGMSEADLDKAADAALQSAYWNPRPIERGPIRALLDDAYHGRRPT